MTAVTSRRQLDQASTSAAPRTGFAAQEIMESIPPVNDLARSLEIGGGRPRFVFGDGGEERMTAHLWETTLQLGLDDATRREVIKSGISPQSMPGPLPARAGLRLMRAGAFHAVLARRGDAEARWISGSLLRGGHADRLVARDTLLPPGSGDSLLPCFACEGDRAPGEQPTLQTVEDVVAPPSMRRLALARDQFALWSRIVEFLGRFSPATTSLVEGMNGAGVEALVRERLPAVAADLEPEGVRGCVMLWNGSPVAADLFSREEDFRRFSTGILRGYLVEAMLRAGAHDAGGLSVLPATSKPGKRALVRLLASQTQGDHLDSWHTFLAAPDLEPPTA